MSEASGSASPAPSAAGGGATPGMRPKRAVRPTVKALLAREQSPDGWEHGGTRRSQPSRPIRTSSGARPQIKLKMKASGGGTAAGVGQGPKTQAYMQSYDRELDSEDDETGEGLAFEEQLIFRMPEGLECDKLREAIQKRQLADDVWFKFKDSRRAVVHVGDSLFSAKLVDLPTITESHKTLDNRQFFKVADITQMLVVEGKIADESQASSSAAGKGFNIEDFIYPHGITPPMHWARKRRFRKRAARRAIETVEKEVERLLKADKKAEQIEYEMIDAVEEGGSEDDEDDQRGGPSRRSAASPGESQAETPMPDGSDAGSQDEDEDEGDEDAGGGGQARQKEQRVREAQLEAECRELETLVRRKQADVDGTMNLIIKNRHQQALRKLTTERDLKRNQLADLKQARKERKEANQAAEQAAEQAAAASSNVDDDGDAISTHGDEMPNQPSPGDSASAAVAGVSSQDAQSVSQNRGMPPPALPASRNPPQSSHSAGPEASISASNQPSAQADHGDNDLWDDDDEEEDNEE
uniref:Related to TAF7-TFIID subunit (TBP-associated factor), 67 kD n=1 Tax=Melanopsichium pennsylvanicum 4 TaxID=1398559 RepID=A0A077QYM2_9BASI|nr:related to TAF7-TFIID subunit (TBP-associated factor), 67 kD [Melanopsichium pennsylvanicum 4]